MNIQIASDLHLEFSETPPPLRSSDLVGDALVLAGDIHGSPAALARWIDRLRRFRHVPVLYVMGNHEFYGKEWARTVESYRGALEGLPDVHFLEKDGVVIDGVRFLGCSLWTDFSGGLDREACRKEMKDYEVITVREGQSSRLLEPDDQWEVHRRSVAWLESVLPGAPSETTVVITHHGPSFQSIDPRWAASGLNGGFASDLEALIRRHGPALWFHGHSHDSADYRIGPTRIVANPSGYPFERNPGWNPKMTVPLS